MLRSSDAVAVRDLGDVVGRIDAEHAGALILESPKQHADIAADVDDKIVGAEAQYVHGRFGEFLPMTTTGGGGRGFIWVVVAIEDLRRHDVVELDKSALVTDHHFQRK